MTARNARSLVLACVMSLCAPALGCLHPPKGGGSLLDAVRTYNDGVRWERFAAAATAVPPRERESFLDERDQLAEDLRITDYEVVRVDDHGDDATVQIKLTWYKDSEGTVRETWARQSWERHGKAWRIVDERRARGAEMPGLAEAVAASDDGGDGGDAGAAE